VTGLAPADLDRIEETAHAIKGARMMKDVRMEAMLAIQLYDLCDADTVLALVKMARCKWKSPGMDGT
jgi:hypothetical protein